MRQYTLRCLGCGKPLDEAADAHRLHCPDESSEPTSHGPALLRAMYCERTFTPDRSRRGMFRYRSWLPVSDDACADLAAAEAGTVAYYARQLGAELGLDRLVVLFNGFWPDRNAGLSACSFKELEARAVVGRRGAHADPLVVAFAGNTGRAFHQVCSAYDVPAIIVVPERALPYLWGTGDQSAAVTLVAVAGDADYYDAIRAAEAIAALPGNVLEGGARNVARRDGMGSAMLAGLELTEELPDHYFQAVGSGTGAIAAWEMAERAVADGRFGPRPPRLHLAQNDPFTIMTDAWRVRQRQLPELDAAEAKRQIDTIKAHVLSNRHPPYAIQGGLFDAMQATSGEMYAVTNRDAEEAAHLFRAVEGCDLDPAAAVALASLQQAAARGAVRRGELTFLNVTGGGYKLLRDSIEVMPLQADATIEVEALLQPNLSDQLAEALEVAGGSWRASA